MCLLEAHDSSSLQFTSAIESKLKEKEQAQIKSLLANRACDLHLQEKTARLQKNN